MTTTPTHAAPWTFRRFLACMFPHRTPARYRAARPGIDHVLTGREAVARHLYGESVHWGSLDMLNYDHSPYLQSFWLAAADRRIAAAKHSDRHIAAWHGHTPEQWEQFSSLAKVDMREGYFKAKGMTA